jgi:hypothetical protein
MYPSIKQAYIFKLIQFEYHDNRYAQKKQSVKTPVLRQDHKTSQYGVARVTRSQCWIALWALSQGAFFAFQNQSEKKHALSSEHKGGRDGEWALLALSFADYH